MPVRRSPQLAWVVTAPLAAITLAITIPLAFQPDERPDQALRTVIFFGLFLAAEATVLHFSLRRHGAVVSLTEIPLLLALFYLSPVLVVATRLMALGVVQVSRRMSGVKTCFNLAAIGAATSLANLVVVTCGSLADVGPDTWLILGTAVAITSTVSAAAVLGVISLVQGAMPWENLVRTAVSVLTVAGINIVVGLIVLLVLQVTPWAVVLLLCLGAILVLVYRSYAQFVGQHKSLSELYELTRAMSQSGPDGTLPDVLLGRVRELMQAEYATLWLPEQGRYPQLLLTARVDDHGLLDVSATPDQLRKRAVTEGTTVAAGPRLGDEDLRAMLREHGTKDAIVAPLRSGGATIGSLEVSERLGGINHFGPADVRLLETLAAHASVAVENSRLVDRLRFDAYHDTLTGLPNRRRVLAALDEAVRVRAPGEVVAVLLFDIDGLRDVNDSLGHSAGDVLVSEIAKRLRQRAPSAALVGRVGGDEFAVTLRMPSADAAVRLATELRNALQQPMELGSITLDVDVAVGIAVHPDHGTESEPLLQRADLATHAAKQLAPPVQLFHPGLESRSAHRLGLAADLRKALEAGDIEVYFQPKVSLAGRQVVGVECLARWEHPAHGQVAPPDFVAVAEHTGQLARLTDVVMREGLRRCRGWLEAGRPLAIAVNLSPRTLIDPAFPVRVLALLDEYDVPPELLTLEITEDGMVSETDRPLPTLRRLREIGVRLSVDDFGTGYSSLSYLRRLPVHEVKIDRLFVQGMATDAGDAAIVRAVVDLSRHFGLSVVAEGVESEMTLTLLEEVGCDVGQGFLFSRPLPYERFEAWLGAQTEPEPVMTSGEPTGEIRRLRAVT